MNPLPIAPTTPLRRLRYRITTLPLWPRPPIAWWPWSPWWWPFPLADSLRRPFPCR